MITLKVNGKTHQVDADPDTPLLWVLRDHLGLTSVKYTCGVSECGLCTVLVNGEAQRSCFVSAAETADTEITTLEGLPEDHPIKLAWIEKQVPQCGYCQPGIMLQAVDFLSREPHPSDDRINQAMNDVICRCGSHPRIRQAIRMASEITPKQGG